MRDLIYGILTVRMRLAIPTPNHPKMDVREKEVTLLMNDYCQKQEAIEHAAKLIRLNPALKNVGLTIKWTPHSHSLDEEVFAAVRDTA